MRTKLSFVIVISSLVILLLVIFVSLSLTTIQPRSDKSTRVASGSAEVVVISDKEKEKIDKWIYKNRLNPYGDSYDSVYTGGTPLFNETTGEKKDRYQYILEQHPDRPWK